VTTILVVDDEPANRALIRAYLHGHGYDLIDAASGDQALVIAAATPIDLVLLDVLMPGLDGFEVARRIRATASETFLPIVLVSALTDQASRRQGLEAGADEFLSKPVDPQELVLRVRNLISLREKARALLERNIEHLELRRFRDEMIALVVHDLKNPLSALLLNLSYAIDGWPGEDTRAALSDAEESAKRLSELVCNLVDVQRLETAALQLRRESIPGAAFLGSILTSRRSHATQRNVDLMLSCDPSIALWIDHLLIRRVIENLLDNAFRYVPVGGGVVIEVTSAAGRTSIRVGNSGPAVPAAARTAIFEKYAVGTTGRHNLGLGLYFCRLALEAHGGSIGIEETGALPTIFVLDLPETP